MSDIFWRCSAVEEANWFANSFDDSSWSNAFVVPTNSMPTLSGFEAGAELIWHYDHENVDTVYCRGKMCIGIQFRVLVFSVNTQQHSFVFRRSVMEEEYSYNCGTSSIFPF